MKILFIEGLPGSGKTTFAKKLHDHYTQNGYHVKYYTEGELHPIDVAWCSVTDKSVFDTLIKKYEKYTQQIIKQTKIKEGKYITAYTKVEINPEDIDFYQDFGQYEVFNLTELEPFKDFYYKLWNSFKGDADLYIFECIFLQNHMTELILKYNYSKEQIHDYLNGLLSQLSVDYHIFHIVQKDIKKTTMRIAEERKSDNPAWKDWIDQVVDYLESTKYAKELGYLGFEGCLKFFEDRQNISIEFLKQIDSKRTNFYLDDDYDKIWDEMKKKDLL